MSESQYSSELPHLNKGVTEDEIAAFVSDLNYFDRPPYGIMKQLEREQSIRDTVSSLVQEALKNMPPPNAADRYGGDDPTPYNDPDY